jgi:DNA-directed RNA polymerase subunit M/transcription elongation factor TFIIS
MSSTSPKKKGSPMEFCPKCESLLRPHKREDGVIILKCNDCGYQREATDETNLDAFRLKKMETKEEKKQHEIKEKLLFMDEEYFNKKMPTTSVTDFKCRKCGYEKCGLVTLQTRRADEGMTHFLICGRCGYKLKIGS